MIILLINISTLKKGEWIFVRLSQLWCYLFCGKANILYFSTVNNRDDVMHLREFCLLFLSAMFDDLILVEFPFLSAFFLNVTIMILSVLLTNIFYFKHYTLDWKCYAWFQLLSGNYLIRYDENHSHLLFILRSRFTFIWSGSKLVFVQSHLI